jgi:hypothetical protein
MGFVQHRNSGHFNTTIPGSPRDFVVYKFAMKEDVEREMRTQLQSLRPLLLAEGGHFFLDLFDDLMQEGEFGVALDVLCDFLLQPDLPNVTKTTVDQIQRLHAAMKIDDQCVEELQKKIA